MRAAVSDTVMSGSLPMSSATTASTIWSLLRLMFRADCRLRRSPVTTIADSSGFPVPAIDAGDCGASAFCVGLPGLCCAVAAGLGGTGGWSCATAGDEIRRNEVSAVVERTTVASRMLHPLLTRRP